MIEATVYTIYSPKRPNFKAIYMTDRSLTEILEKFYNTWKHLINLEDIIIEETKEILFTDEERGYIGYHPVMKHLDR